MTRANRGEEWKDVESVEDAGANPSPPRGAPPWRRNGAQARGVIWSGAGAQRTSGTSWLKGGWIPLVGSSLQPGPRGEAVCAVEHRNSAKEGKSGVALCSGVLLLRRRLPIPGTPIDNSLEKGIHDEEKQTNTRKGFNLQKGCVET